MINGTKYWLKGIDQGVHPIPKWISNYMPSKEWAEITYPFPNFNEVCEWINNFSPYCVMNMIIDPCWQKGPLKDITSFLSFSSHSYTNSANTGTFQSNCECLGISDYMYISLPFLKRIAIHKYSVIMRNKISSCSSIIYAHCLVWFRWCYINRVPFY